MNWDASDLARSMEDAVERIIDGTLDGLEDATEHILGKSKPLAPVDSGDLRKSGNTDIDEDRLRASVYYNTPYAVVQHEAMGRATAKYLERPFTAEAKAVGEIIARSIRSEL